MVENMSECRWQIWKVLLEKKEKERSDHNIERGSNEDQRWKYTYNKHAAIMNH